MSRFHNWVNNNIIIIIIYFCPLFFLQVFMCFCNLSSYYNLTEKGWSLDLMVIFLRSGTPTRVMYDVHKTMIALILGTILVCNFFLTIVNKFFMSMSINLIFFFVFFNTIVATVSVFYH